MAFVIGMDVTRVDTTAQWKLGTIGEVFDGAYKVYKYVKYKEAAAATAGVAGEVAYYDGQTAGDGYKNNEVTSDLSDSDEIGAGVLQANMSDNEFGWIQIKGPATLTIALTAGSDGSNLTPTGATDGTLDLVTAATDHICAIAGDITDKEIICDFPF